LIIDFVTHPIFHRTAGQPSKNPKKNWLLKLAEYADAYKSKQRSSPEEL